MQTPASPAAAAVNARATSRRVLVVDRDKRQLKVMVQTLRCLVEQVETRDDLESVQPGEYDLIVASYDGLSEPDRAKLAQGVGGTRSRLLLLSEGRARQDLVTLFGQRALTNLVAKDDELDASDLIVTIQKIFRGDIFGIEKYFSWGVQSERFPVQRSTEKDRLLEAARTYVERIGIHPRLCDLYCNVADELITNAVYNAPVDGEGRYRHAHRARTEQVELDAGEEVVVSFCCDGRRLGISATDPFGSLSPEQVQNYLAKCFRRGDDQVDRKQGGAGLGLYYVFESLNHLVINIDRGRRTELIGLFDVRGSYKDFVSRGKSFNIFMSES